MRHTPTLLMAMMIGTLAAAPALAQDDEGFVEGDVYPGDEPGEEEGYFYVEEGEGQPGEAPEGEVDIAYFFDKMAPHGEWIWTPEYGWVWHPRGVWNDWRPYTYGRWVYTDHGWTWSSNFAWGWAAFHYGTWAYLDYIGWVWVPGTVWSPAWVMWRHSDAYIGWAPVLAGYDMWWGWAYYPVYYDHWTFIGWGRFCDPHPHHHYVSRRRVHNAFRHTYFPRNCRSRSGAGCHRGPSQKIVRQRVKEPIPIKKLENIALRPDMRSARKNPASIKGDVLQLHRPRFKKGPQRMDVKRTTAAGARKTQDLGVIPNSSRPKVRAPVNTLDRNTRTLDRSTRVRSVNGPSTTERRRPSPGRFIHPRQPSSKPPAVRGPGKRVKNRPSKPSFQRSRSAPKYRAPTRSAPKYRTPTRSAPRIRTSPSKSRPVRSAPKVRSAPVRSTPKVRGSPSKSRSSSFSPRSRSSSSPRSRSSSSGSRSSSRGRRK